MKTKTSYTAPEPTEEEIQKQAYYLWLESGRPEGRDLEHWDAARELLRHRARLHEEHDLRKSGVVPLPANGKLNVRRPATARALSTARGASSN